MNEDAQQTSLSGRSAGSGRPPSVHAALRFLRILSQSLFFGLFLYLLVETRFSGKDEIGPVETFFHFDPLIGLAAQVASRALLTAFLWALVPIVLTLIFGRYACGWACPLGAILQFFSFLFKKTGWHVPGHKATPLLSLKYVVLAVVLAGSVLTLDLAGLLDPLSLLFRSFSVSILPASAVATGAVLSAVPDAGWATVRESLMRSLEALALDGTFPQGLFIGLIFLSLVLLNLYRERFFCRYLCPAGALFGLLARWNLVKVRIDKERCNGCRACTLHCQTQATPYPSESWTPAECVYCYSCSLRCPTAAITFPLELRAARLKPRDRAGRRLILGGALGLVLVPLFRVSSPKRAPDRLIRPPGALPEPRFLAACVKCGECMKVCPTNALQPALGAAGPEGLWTPVLVPRIGYCEYYCSLCTQVCPTAALRELSVKEKVKVCIGSAWIKKDRCIPYVEGRACTVCEEQCPTSPKAVNLVETELMTPDGSWASQRVPLVDLDLCIGCGICETKCPVEDEPAIYCTSLGESRAQEG
jgi:NAD-dependent dihydropyrimidine dehydrogenase PreA subunit